VTSFDVLSFHIALRTTASSGFGGGDARYRGSASRRLDIGFDPRYGFATDNGNDGASVCKHPVRTAGRSIRQPD
jgi:hypothetical protein